MIHQKTRKKFFWIVLVICLLLGGGQTLSTSASDSSDLIISEFLADNGTGLMDEDGDYSDWIEIYNRGSLAVNLAGWALTDDPSQPQKWPLPDMTLGSQEYLLVFASGKDRTSTEPDAVLHTNFKLRKTGEFLALHNILEDKFMDEISQYPEQFRDTSYGRYGDDLDYGYLNRPTPGAPNDVASVQLNVVSPVQFSVERGFYEAPVTVELANATTGATIRYTTDGSVPSETNGTIYAEPISIDTTTLLRAAAFKPNLRPSEVETHSYLFLDDLLTQPAVLSGLPVSRGTQLTASQGYLEGSLMAADYEMDPEVVNDSQYKHVLEEGLKSIPTISLVMSSHSFDNLYTHPTDRGQSSEQAVSVEFISLDGTEARFQINAGLRPHGSLTTPKQSFRLLFKGEYGSTKLEYPLFSDSPVSQFDSLLLLDGGNDSFVGSTSTEQRMTYTRGAWLRASQLAMADLGAHDRFVHLYLNGLYWGLYNLVERPDSSFMASYLGGEKEDWFVADQAGPLGNSDGVGRLNDLFTLLNLSGRVGVNPDHLTQIYTEVAASLDRTQFSDYLILNWYTGVEKWPENWYVGIHRQDIMGRRGKLIIGENAEIFKSDGAKMALGERGGYSTSMTEAIFDTLIQDPDFKVQLADRMYKHLFNDGALTDTNARNRWLQLSGHLEQAILAELARWGDTNRETSLTQDDWFQANDEILAQIDGNAARLIALAREAGYYPPIDPPTMSLDGGLVEAGFALTMMPPASCQDCTIYYTTNGSDPRLPVTGQVFPQAVAYSTPVVLTTSTQLKARVFSPAFTDTEQSWSALHEAAFNVTQPGNKLRITEVMYNPIDGDDYEFIELKNIGDSVMDLANVSLDEGIRFTFPPNTPLLAPNEFAVLVSNPEAFAERYPDIAISGAYEGHFSNKGEKIVLRDAEGQTLLEFEYNDENGWPLSPDGRGDSMTLIDENGDPNNPKNWRASRNLYGSPGLDEL
jgi:hypothetical protein